MAAVYVAPSIWRSMDPRTSAALIASIHSNPSGDNLILEPLWNDALIARSRSILATRFLASDADVMVIFDDDIVWNPADFWKLIEGARETKAIYCGPFVTRSKAPHLASRCYPGQALEIYASPNRRPVEIEYAATGFVAIHRNVFAAILGGEFEDADGTHRVHKCTRGGGEPFYPFFATFTKVERDGEMHYLSEDWAFCERARQLGFAVWMDQGIILEHMGWYPFTVNDLNVHNVGGPSTGTDVVEVQPRDQKTGEPIIDDLFDDIAAWAEEDAGDVRRMAEASSARLAELWESRPEGQSEGEWYAREDVGMAYVGDLAWWHVNGGIDRARKLIAELRKSPRKVLDFGAGIGTASFLFARAGAVVVAVEPNPVMREFMKHRLNGAAVVVCEAMPPHGAENFNAIIAWHVFEHLPDPEAALLDLRALLGAGGVLITESDFEQHGTHPMHHVRSDWEDVLAAAGFVRVADGLYRLERPQEGAPKLSA